MPQHLLDRAGEQPGVGAQGGELVGMPQQRQNAVGDEVRGRLVPGDEQQDAGGDQFGLGELVALFLDQDQPGQQVVARRAAADRDQRGEVLGELALRGLDIGHLGRVGDRHGGVQRADQIA